MATGEHQDLTALVKRARLDPGHLLESLLSPEQRRQAAAADALLMPCLDVREQQAAAAVTRACDAVHDALQLVARAGSFSTENVSRPLLQAADLIDEVHEVLR